MGLLDLEELRTATRNVAEISAWIEKDPAPTNNELDRARARIAADTTIRPVGGSAVEATW